ncbi:MAG: alpha/beta hydrolase [Muribaculum sp.]|nr:alpha/beta hydrolase [Muribaculum sp.]
MNIKKTLATIVLATAAVATCSAQWTPTKKIIDIAEPNIKVFLPNDDLNTGRAIVALPGGSYLGHAYHHEGYDWAPFFNKQGIALIVVRYKLPAGDRTLPIGDAETAIKMVRDSAAVWNINPEDVGIMGSSAGGHLASTIATHTKKGTPQAPNFQILFYPVISMQPGLTHQMTHDNFCGENPSKELEAEFSNELQCTPDTPRAFIATSDDDEGVPAANSALYYLGLNKAGVPATLHIYPAGRHGWGILDSFQYNTEMLNDLSAWLRSF